MNNADTITGLSREALTAEVYADTAASFGS